MSNYNNGWKRPPSPPLRAPSPLGQHDDGVKFGVPANLARAASCPPIAQVPPRAPSPVGLTKYLAQDRSTNTNMFAQNATAPPLRPPVRPALEVAMDPDNWSPGRPPSNLVNELNDATLSVKECYLRVYSFLDALTISNWRPVFLSPSDVQHAAMQWQLVERTSLTASKEAIDSTRVVLEVAVAGGFMKREEAQEALASLKLRPVAAEGVPQRAGDVSRPTTTLGYRPVATTLNASTRAR
ncbi:hypothetical protein P7C70_g603, partial [Phenoliferia sp. Uapishka_3]